MEEAKAPTLKISQRDFDDLLEYSCSLPTGTTIGKRWKRNQSAYVTPRKVLFGLITRRPKANWFIGEYVESKQGGMVDINWYKPSIS